EVAAEARGRPRRVAREAGHALVAVRELASRRGPARVLARGRERAVLAEELRRARLLAVVLVPGCDDVLDLDDLPLDLGVERRALEELVPAPLEAASAG